MTRFHIAASLFLVLAATACESATAPGESPETQVTVDASAGWAYVRLDAPARLVSISNPAVSQEWDMAFNATSVMLNGGAAGPGGVDGYCLCANAGATAAQILAMTPASELASYEAVTSASIPSGSWKSDALAPAIAGWYAYNPTTHAVTADTSKAFKLRLSSGATPSYAAFRVRSMAGGTQSSPGLVTIDYVVQSSATAPLSAIRTAVLDASAGRAYFDFDSGTSSSTNWDISLEGYSFRVNGGVSGTGGAGAVAAGEPLHTITTAGDVPAQVYKGDSYGGVFTSSPWHRYNLTGQHDISPTYDVYLIRRGATVYKVQVTGYYSVTGAARHISFRSERIAG